jgi:hypothetical protein
MPVGCGRPAVMSTSPICTGAAGARTIAGGSPPSAPDSSSASVFQAPHPAH